MYRKKKLQRSLISLGINSSEKQPESIHAYSSSKNTDEPEQRVVFSGRNSGFLWVFESSYDLPLNNII